MVRSNSRRIQDRVKEIADAVKGRSGACEFRRLPGFLSSSAQSLVLFVISPSKAVFAYPLETLTNYQCSTRTKVAFLTYSTILLTTQSRKHLPEDLLPSTGDSIQRQKC